MEAVNLVKLLNELKNTYPESDYDPDDPEPGHQCAIDAMVSLGGWSAEAYQFPEGTYLLAITEASGACSRIDHIALIDRQGYESIESSGCREYYPDDARRMEVGLKAALRVARYARCWQKWSACFDSKGNYRDPEKIKTVYGGLDL